MKLKYKAKPYVVKATSLPVDNPRERVARHLRGSWIKRNSVITLSLFQSLRDAVNYFNDSKFIHLDTCANILRIKLQFFLF